MEQVNEILKQVSKIRLENLDEKYTFRLSLKYCIKAFLFLAVIIAVFLLEIGKFSKRGIIQKAICVLLLIYIVFYLYKLIKYKIVIENYTLIYDKNKVDLRKIKKIQLMRTRVGGSKYDNCLMILTNENIKYIIRLNISDKYKFIALISKISKMKVES